MKPMTESQSRHTRSQPDASRFLLDQERGTFRLLARAPPDGARVRQIRRARTMASLADALAQSASEIGSGVASPAPDWDWRAGSFLRALMSALQPTLQTALRSRQIVLSGTSMPLIALRSDGMFVRVDRAGQEEVQEPVQICRIHPDLARILDAISAELVAVEQGVEIWGALALLRQCRSALSVGVREPPPRSE